MVIIPGARLGKARPALSLWDGRTRGPDRWLSDVCAHFYSLLLWGALDGPLFLAKWLAVQSSPLVRSTELKSNRLQSKFLASPDPNLLFVINNACL